MDSAAHDPTAEEVERWNQHELLEWIQQKRPELLEDDQLEKFKAARISGEIFLDLAGNPDTFERNLNLAFGVSRMLANLAAEIVGMETARMKRHKKRPGDAEMSDIASKKSRRESDGSSKLHKLATSACQQRERIRQLIKELDQQYSSISKDVDQPSGAISKNVDQPSDSIFEDVDPFPNFASQLSNPAFHIKLPFPFVGYAVPERFQVNSKDHESKWYYMGREKFAELRHTFESVRDDRRRIDLIVYGTRGYGKSHLLAALVCYWAAGDRKVIYIPNCRHFVKDSIRYMKSAMLFAWADDEREQQEIMALKTREEIHEFIQEQEDVIFVIDQINALEKEREENDTDYAASMKREVHEWLDCLTATHKSIYSSSANNFSMLNKASKQSNSIRMDVYGGLTENEMKHWWARKQVLLGDYTKYEVEDLTGCIPLLLENCVVGGEINLAADVFTDIDAHARAFERHIQTHRSQEDLRWHNEYMKSCFFNLPVSMESRFMPKLVDHRYFYNKDSVGHYTCGISRDAVASMILENRWRFDDKDFLQSLPKEITNPCVAGFMIETAVLSSIVLNGLNITADLNKQIDPIFFEGKFPTFDITKGKLRLYVPKVFNFRNIDGIIVHVGPTPKRKTTRQKLFMFPLQITLAPDKHSKSRTKFFNEWGKWTEGLQGFEVVPEFVWISPKAGKSAKYAGSDQCPAHLERYVTIEHVNKGIWDWYNEGKRSKRIISE